MKLNILSNQVSRQKEELISNQQLKLHIRKFVAMSTEVQELPERGEIVLTTITKIMDHGAYVTLDEYDGLQGFLHISEIAPGWIRSISRFVKNGEKKVLLVKRVGGERSDIDLSLKQVSIDQKKKKLLEVKRYEKGNTLFLKVQEKAIGQPPYLRQIFVGTPTLLSDLSCPPPSSDGHNKWTALIRGHSTVDMRSPSTLFSGDGIKLMCSLHTVTLVLTHIRGYGETKREGES